MEVNTAPSGQVFVCMACGKRSKDIFGDMKIDRGWDVSCAMNCVLCYEKKDNNDKWVVVKNDE